MRSLAITGFVILLASMSEVCCAQWVQTGGPVGGTFTGLVSLDSVLFAGSDRGIYRSTNSGLEWTPCNFNFSTTAITVLAVCNENVFAGTAQGGGIFRSTDHGNSWIPVNTGLDSWRVSAIVMHGDSLFAGIYPEGVFCSIDQGMNWFSVNSGTSTWYVTSLCFIGSKLCATTDYGVMLSTDNGSTWAGTTSVPPFNAVVNKGNDIFIAGNGVWRSTDQGSTWVLKNAGLTDTPFCNINRIATDGKDLFAGAFDPDNGIFCSSDDGESWVEIDNAMYGKDQSFQITSMCVQDSFLFVGNQNRGIFRTSNVGTTWAPVDFGLTTDCSGLALYDDGVKLIAASEYGLSFSTDDTRSWSPPTFGPPYPDCFARIDSNLFCGSWVNNEGGIFRSSDHGISWIEPDSQLNVPGSGVFALVTVGSILIAGINNGILKSTDLGISWTQVLDADERINALTTKGSIVIAGAMLVGAYRSSDSGLTWSACNNGLPQLASVFALAVKGPNLFAGTDRGTFRSSDNGGTWILENNGMPVSNTSSFAVDSVNIFTGTDSGVFYSKDDGYLWSRISAGVNNISLDTFAVSSLIVSDSFLFVGVLGDGVWRRPLSDFGISSVSQTQLPPLPQIQSYPNPFSQSTTITFSSQEEGYAEVTILNLLGAHVAQLFSGELAPGEHSFLWGNPTGLPPGTYWCEIRINGKSDRIPLVLVK